jgi:hypothetical protein
MEAALSIIQNFGFPIAVCLWFMLRTEKIITKNTEAVNSLAQILSKKLK